MQGTNSEAFLEMGLSESFLRILKHSYDAILITLKDSTIVFVNNSYSRILGVSAERLLGRKLSEVEPNSITLDVLKTGKESIHVYEYIATLDEWLFGSVLLLPSPKDSVGSISIITKLKTKIRDESDLPSQRYIDSYMDEILFLDKTLPSPFSKVIGKSRKLRQALFNAYKASNADFPVLVLGESGTGKELFVKAIHEASSRKDHEFVTLNCAAITSTLIESELFGYEPGAFTGAKREGKAGMFDLANKGTLFFDEIGDFELAMQSKILRVLEERVFKRVGGEKDIHVDTRVISATNKDLEEMMLKGKFREDLFYRINTMTIYIPPLRFRGPDIELLANHFLLFFCHKYNKKTQLHDDTMAIFYAYNWPGNVRELRSVLDYSVNMTDTSFVTPNDIPAYLTLNKVRSTLGKRMPRLLENRGISEGVSVYKNLMGSFEKDLIETALKKNRTRTEAMKMLGLSRRSFYLKLNKYGFI